MRRIPAVLVAGAAVAALAFPAVPAGADPVGACPDGFILMSAALTQGNADQNGDGFVCGKPANGKFVGGPDPHPPIPGAELMQVSGEYWWIVDNTY